MQAVRIDRLDAADVRLGQHLAVARDADRRERQRARLDEAAQPLEHGIQARTGPCPGRGRRDHRPGGELQEGAPAERRQAVPARVHAGASALAWARALATSRSAWVKP